MWRKLTWIGRHFRLYEINGAVIKNYTLRKGYAQGF